MRTGSCEQYNTTLANRVVMEENEGQGREKNKKGERERTGVSCFTRVLEISGFSFAKVRTARHVSRAQATSPGHFPSLSDHVSEHAQMFGTRVIGF